MTKFDVEFNGYSLSNVVRITDVIRPIGNERNLMLNETVELGASVTGVKVSGKIIKVKFSIQDKEIEHTKHELARVFHTTSLSKLTFSDEPDKYYLAFVMGGIETENVKWWLQKGEIKFYIPDGVAHSNAYKTYKTPRVEDRKLVFDIENNGSVPAYPIINAVHTDENGYLGFVCVENKADTDNVQYSLMEVGTRHQFTTETESVQKSKSIFDYKDMTTALNAGTKGQAVPGVPGSYNATFITESGTNNQKRLTVSSGASSIAWTIPQDASSTTNERLSWNQSVFSSGFNLTGGSINVVLSDTAGQFLYGVECIKTEVFDSVRLRLIASNGQGGSNVLRSQEFTNQNYSYLTYGRPANLVNPFSSTGGNVELRRNDQTVTLTFPGGNWTIQIPEIKGKKTGKVHVIIAKDSSPFNFAPMMCGIHTISYRMDYTPEARKIPNRYPVGSEIEINCETDRIIVNGLDRMNDLVHGSGFLKIPPGKSTIEVYRSDFSVTPPRIEISFEERWL